MPSESKPSNPGRCHRRLSDRRLSGRPTIFFRPAHKKITSPSLFSRALENTAPPPSSSPIFETRTTTEMASNASAQREARFARVTPATVEENGRPCIYCARRMIAHAGRPSSHRLDQKFGGRVVCCYLRGRLPVYEKFPEYLLIFVKLQTTTAKPVGLRASVRRPGLLVDLGSW
jgi:hypothetical protein